MHINISINSTWLSSINTRALTSDRWETTVWIRTASLFPAMTFSRLDSSLESENRLKPEWSGWCPDVQIATVRSLDPVARKCPDFEKAQVPTCRECWSSRCRMCPEVWNKISDKYFFFYFEVNFEFYQLSYICNSHSGWWWKDCNFPPISWSY